MSEIFSTILIIAFWFSACWLCYIFVFYPLLMASLARLNGKPLKRTEFAELPRVAMIMAAYNEEGNIRAKLQNYLDLDYPRDRLSFYIGSDNSTDATDDIIQEFQQKDPTIHLRRYDRSGKTKIVYTLAEELTEAIHVYTDTDALLDKQGMRLIVDCFSDPEVGGVIGRMNYHDREGGIGSSGERKYMGVEDTLRIHESLVWTTIAPTGPCISVRKGCYDILYDYRLSDDLNLSITTSLNGYRVWYCPELVIHETNKRTLWSEAKRRLRMGRQSFATYRAYPGTKFPWQSFVAFQVWSHKLLRNLSGIPTVILAITAVALTVMDSGLLYNVFGIGTAAFLVIAVIGLIADRFKVNAGLFGYPLYFTIMMLCLTVGSLRAIVSGGLEMWSSPRLSKNHS